ncbi:MAG: zinc transporter ZupT [Fermentimonas sp.]
MVAVTQSQVLIAFLITLFAGLSTGVGGAIAFFTKRTNKMLLSVSLGFSAGIMIYVSFVELLSDSFATLSGIYGDRMGGFYGILSFFAGIFVIAIIDRLVPERANPHEMHSVEEIKCLSEKKDGEMGMQRKVTVGMSEGMIKGITGRKIKGKRERMEGKREIDYKMLRIGLFTALVIAIHNFPEGMVTFLSGLKDIKIAIPIAIAVAIHNIPEGIAVSVPICYATGNRKKAFWLSLLSGLSEPLGAIVGYLVLAPFLTEAMLGVLFGMIAGIMVYISFDELLPAAEEYGKHHHAIYGLIGGMAVMALSLLFL